MLVRAATAIACVLVMALAACKDVPDYFTTATVALESEAEPSAQTSPAPDNREAERPVATSTRRAAATQSPSATASATVTLPPTFTRPAASQTPRDTSTPSPAAEVESDSTPAITLTYTPAPATPTAAPPAPAPAGETSSSLSPAPVGAAGPSYYETTISIPTYNYEAAFTPTQPEDSVYPYPRLDFSRVGPPAPRSYRAIVLENGFVSLTILPELGGRIYSWVDKATGRELLYQNPVVKPTEWGYRGWWLAAGGIEWAFPVEEHGLNEWRPWNASVGNTGHGLGVTVSNIDDRTGMEVGATISLGSGYAYVAIQPWARNNTAQSQPYQLWLNAMIAMGGNHVSGPTQFIVPAGEVTIHSASDGGVPASGNSMSWPFYGGRDMSWYSNWNGHIGFFAPGVYAGFTGIYDHAFDQGIVRAYSPGWPAGTKIFGPSTLSPTYWTDDNSNYVELWSGATGSFWSNGTLNPGDNFGWTEYWYPVHGMGGFNYANRLAALRLVDTGGGGEISVAVSGGVNGQVTLWAGGHLVAEWPLTIYPGQTFTATWSRPEGLEGGLGLRLESSDGTIIAQSGQVP